MGVMGQTHMPAWLHPHACLSVALLFYYPYQEELSEVLSFTLTLVTLSCDAQEYPTTAAFSIITKVLDEYIEQNGDSWQKVDADVLTGNALLELAIVKYQDHTQADKLSKIQKDLDETKIILHQARAGRGGGKNGRSGDMGVYVIYLTCL